MNDLAASNQHWNFANVWEGVASVVPDRPALLHDGRAISWAEFDRRSNALARFLLDRGAVAGDKLAIYAYNRPEWMITLAAAFKARLVPVNVNYRYRAEELAYILENSDSVAIIFEGCFTDSVAALVENNQSLTTLVQVADENPLAGFATSWDDALSGDDSPLDIERSGEDMVFLYTGGTTGMPKAVMWPQAALWGTLGGGGELLTGANKPADLDEHLSRVGDGDTVFLLPACPLMHGTGLFTAINSLVRGGCVVTLPSRSFDAQELWSSVERDRVQVISMVGDVFARPMLAALEERAAQSAAGGKKAYDLSSLVMMVSSGVMWTPETKEKLLDHHPGMALVDALGASEATGMGTSVQTAETKTETARFAVGDNVKVFTDDGLEVVPGSGERGRVARCGPIPAGYYKDPEKSAQTFPVINGVRYSMPGDYATVAEDGTLVLLGRGSQCINTGGEKVYPEELEEVLKRHPSVEDAAVVGLPDEKWGQAITALVTPAEGTQAGEDELRQHVRELLAAFKVPKRVFCVDSLGRTPAGKMDYKNVTARALELVDQDQAAGA